MLDGGAARDVQLDAHLVREDVRERRLAEAGRAAEQDVIERLLRRRAASTKTRRFSLCFVLPDVVVERARPKDAIEALVVAEHGARSQPRRHGLTIGGRGERR